MNLVYAILFLAGICGWLFFSSIPSLLRLKRWVLPVALMIKFCVGLLFFHFNQIPSPEAHELNDAGTFLHEGKILNDVFYTSPSDYFKLLFGIDETTELVQQHMEETDHWSSGDQSLFADNKNIIRFHSLIYFISLDNPYIHLIVFSLIALIGICLMAFFVRKKTTIPPLLIIGILFFLPSTLYWSSSVLKEPFMLLGFGIICFGLTYKNAIHSFLIILVGLLILIGFKPAVGIALLPALLFYVGYSLSPKRKVVSGTLTTLIPVVLSIVIQPSIIDKGTHLLSRKQFDFMNVSRGGLHVKADTCFYYFEPDQYAVLEFSGDSVLLTSEIDAWIVQHGSIKAPSPIHLTPQSSPWLIYFQNKRAGSYIDITPIQGSTQQLIHSIPEALINVFLRPFPNDPGSTFKWMAFIEQSLILLVLLGILYQNRAILSHHIKWILFFLCFAFTLALLIGWTTPALGAIVRYRIPIQLSFVLLGLLCWKPITLHRS